MAISLKEVDGIAIQAKNKATCHCGAVGCLSVIRE